LPTSLTSRATTNISDRPLIADFIVPNHLESTARNIEELDQQILELKDDFPDLYDDKIFVRGRYWIIENGNQMVATLGLTPDPENPQIVWISFMGVATSHRNQGIAKNMLTNCLKYAKIHYTIIRVVSLPGVLDAACHLYKSFGFEEISSIQSQYYTVTIFQKVLDDIDFFMES
jgi:GNAT superfamily N-acetyltransferase